MTKPPERWALWKIVAVTLGCAAVAAVLLWLSAVLGEGEGGPTEGSWPGRPALTGSGFLMMLGAGALVLTTLGLIWLGFRINEARKPPWKRRGKKRRR